jgi:Tfp pilus assembly protein PilF
MKSKSVLFLAAFCLLGGTGLAAAQLGNEPAPTGGTMSTRPDSIQDTGYWGYMANSPAGVVSGGWLFGKVVVQGNPLLWEPVPVVVICSPDKIALMTQTDADGRYSITHVNLPKVDTLNGDVHRQMEQHFEGCTVRAELAGYRSTTDTITERVLRDKPFLQDLTLTAEENAPGTDISFVKGSASSEAQNSYQKAHEEWLHRNSEAAKSDLEQAVKVDPKFAEAWYLLGRLQAASDVKAATASLQQAQALDPRFVPPCVWLAMIAIQKRDWQEASLWASRALAIEPAGTAQIWYENAVADYRLGKNEAARAAAQHALAMDPEHSVRNVEDVLALTLIDKGDYSGALDHLRNSLTYVSTGPDAELIKRQIAFVEQRVSADKK